MSTDRPGKTIIPQEDLIALQNAFDQFGCDYRAWPSEVKNLLQAYANDPALIKIMAESALMQDALCKEDSPVINARIRDNVLAEFEVHKQHAQNRSVATKSFASAMAEFISDMLTGWRLPALAGGGVVAACLGVILSLAMQPGLAPEEELVFYLSDFDEIWENIDES